MKGTVVPRSRDAHSRPPLLTSLPTACQNRSALLQQSRVPTTAPDVTSRFVSLAWTQNQSDRQQTSGIDKEPPSIFDPLTRDGGVSAVSCNITDNKRFWRWGERGTRRRGAFLLKLIGQWKSMRAHVRTWGLPFFPTRWTFCSALFGSRDTKIVCV